MEFLDLVDKEIARIDTGSEEGIEALLEKIGDLASDLRLLQQDLLIKAQAWGSELDFEQEKLLNTFLACVNKDLENHIRKIEELAADRAAALDDLRGNIDEVVSGSLLARSENGFQQAQAGYSTASQIIEQMQDLRYDIPPETGQELLAQLDERLKMHTANLAAVRDGRGRPELAPGPGAKSKDLARHNREISAALTSGGTLPAVHENLSEAQLIRLQIERFARENPELAPYFENFDERFSQEMNRQLSESGWNTIETSFHDIDPQGRLQKLTSRITPAPQFSEPAFQENYAGKGVPCSDRTQGRHVNNLAHSELTDEKKQVIFSGLRHGIVDAYDIRPGKLARLPDQKLRQLVSDTLLEDDQWRQFASQLRGRNIPSQVTDATRERLIREDMAILRAGRGRTARFAAARARAVANANAARELVAAAVASNPALQTQALADGRITIELDSVSLVTPDQIRDRGSKEGERTYLANQSQALSNMAARPLTVRLANGYGGSQEVQVTVKPRLFNFAVNEYGIGTGGTRSLFKRFMGWKAADRINRQSLTALIGDPAKTDEVGGEAARLISHLQGNRDAAIADSVRVTVDEQGAEAGSRDRRKTAFDDPEKRIQAIRDLSRQIKEIFSSRSHRRGGNEPYKLASRVALLSNLLGRSTCYNCKSGKDRTGQLDAATKLLAVDAAAGRLPVPDTVPDQRRSTNFVLKTGNLEMQQHNTGLRGYKLFGVPALFSQLASPLARRMFSGDSKLVKS